MLLAASRPSARDCGLDFKGGRPPIFDAQFQGSVGA